MSVILAYIFYFVAASASPLQRRWLAKKKDIDGKGQIHFAFQVSIVIALLSLLLPLFSPFYIAGNIKDLVLLALISGIFGAGTLIISYKVQKHVEAGVSSLLNNINTPITIILATVLLGEKLLPIQIYGTVLLLVGIVVVAKKHRIGRFKFDKYFMLLILGGILLALDIVAERALQKITGFTAGVMIMMWAQCLFLGCAVLISKSKSLYSRKDITITGGLRFLQILSWAILVFVVGNLSLVSAVTTFKVIIIFIAGALFLKERDDLPRKITGSLIAVIGLLLMK
jgi:drug/metabolite transporter (DMT)-like permease